MVVGQGTRLFPESGPDTALELVETQTSPSGATIQVYRSTGRPQYGPSTSDMEHVTVATSAILRMVSGAGAGLG